MQTYKINSVLLVDQDRSGNTRLRCGTGSNRESYVLSTQASQAFCKILQLGTSFTLAQIQQNIEPRLGSYSTHFVDFLVKQSIIVKSETSNEARRLLESWTSRGWRAAAIHHLSGYGAQFMPDEKGGADYKDIYRGMLADTSLPQQPPAVKSVLNGLVKSPIMMKDNVNCGVSAEEAFRTLKHIYAFDSHSVSLSEIHTIAKLAFSNQKHIDTGLGSAVLRSYPSGGARHPLELYLFERGKLGSSSKLYYFHPDSCELHQLHEDSAIGEIVDKACFMKRGVRSADYCIFLSTRWLRHMWKYRYARSYKMVLLELGHAIQAINFAALSQGIQMYYCPSFNDSVVNHLCRLDDPYQESVSAVLAFGRNGLTVSQYKERYDIDV